MADELQPHSPAIRILVAGGDLPEAPKIANTLRASIPDASIVLAKNQGALRHSLRSDEFALLVLDEDLLGANLDEFISELRCSESSPTVLLLARSNNIAGATGVPGLSLPHTLVKSDNWLHELTPAIRQLLRMRRLVEENNRLVARLTEANKLLEDRNRRLDEFSATLAHDIRGPLGAVMMRLDYLLEKHGEQLDGRIQDLLGRSNSSLRRLTEVVQAMYEYAKLGGQASRMSQVDLAATLKEIAEDLSITGREEIKLNLGHLPTVWGNRELLRRVFLNLIQNSLKYTIRRPIELSFEYKRRWSSALGDFADISVSDNGPGLPQDKIGDNLFAMFSRGSSNPDQSDGLGVGLAVVQRIVELHNGRIAVESSTATGTTFTISLPLEKIELKIGG